MAAEGEGVLIRADEKSRRDIYYAREGKGRKGQGATAGPQVIILSCRFPQEGSNLNNK